MDINKSQTVKGSKATLDKEQFFNFDLTTKKECNRFSNKIISWRCPSWLATRKTINIMSIININNINCEEKMSKLTQRKIF